MSGKHGTPPKVPDEFKVPLYYEADHAWQRKFTIIWTSLLAAAVLAAAPRFIRAIKKRRAFTGAFGVHESWGDSKYQPLASGNRSEVARAGPRLLEASLNKAVSFLWWSIPGLELNAGQIILIVGYLVVVLLCMIMEADLSKNSNRPGYIALSQLPVVFLFATKNSILSLILGPGNGYEKLNFVHRWSGRIIFLASVLHGAMWIQSHRDSGSPIMGELKETSGIAAFGILCVIVLSSLRPVRRMWYEVFNVIHILAFISFFITVCVHSSAHVTPWVFPPLFLYGADLLMRMLRVRVKDAVLVPVNSQLTLVHIPDCTDGWVAGQHLRLRVFSSGRVFESHPFSIFTAPPGLSCITSFPSGISLGARVMGDWTKALNDYARETGKVMQELEESCEEKKEVGEAGPANVTPVPEVPVQVMIDGPYGGCSIDLGRYETVLLFAGGAGATFTLGLLDDIVGRCVKMRRQGGEVTKRIEFAWCVRSFGSIDWFAPALMDIAKVAEKSDLALHISVYVTCLCNPEAVPPIPNCDVTVVRPTVYSVLADMLTPPGEPSASSSQPKGLKVGTSKEADVQNRPSTAATGVSEDPSDEVDFDKPFQPSVRNRLPWVGLGGGIAMCASGPEGLTREASNAVARLHMHYSAKDLGPVGLHTEVFGL